MSNFVIIGTPRSGTTMLINSLNNIKDIHCYGEILTKKIPSNDTLKHWQPEMVKQRKKKIDNCYGTWLKNNNGNLSDFLDYKFNESKHVGLKMLYPHYIKNQNTLDKYFTERDIKFIYIERKDIIKQAISHKLKKSEKFENKIYIDPEWVYKKSDQLKKMNDHIKQIISDHDHITLIYEQITGDKEIKKLPGNISKKILNLIKYNDFIDIPVKIKKHWPSKLEDRIINYKEFM